MFQEGPCLTRTVCVRVCVPQDHWWARRVPRPHCTALCASGHSWLHTSRGGAKCRDCRQSPLTQRQSRDCSSARKAPERTRLHRTNVLKVRLERFEPLIKGGHFRGLSPRQQVLLYTPDMRTRTRPVIEKSPVCNNTSAPVAANQSDVGNPRCV